MQNMLKNMKDWALYYAKLGYPVFPCKPGTKVPLTPHGYKDATTDLEQIARWWDECPNANIAIATTSLAVIDVDDTDSSWYQDEEIKLALATAGAISMTPRDGRHYLFQKPEDKAWHCSVGKLAPGIDVRTTNGYIVVPPSRIGDKVYAWVEGCELDRPLHELPFPPAKLIELLDNLNQTNTQAAKFTDIGIIPEGQRNETLFRQFACRLRGLGCTQDEIEAALITFNNQHCQPPLPLSEIKTIAASAARYPPGKARQEAFKSNGSQTQTKPTEQVAAVVLAFRPFPVNALPTPIRKFVTDAAAALDCDPSYIALPLLTAAAAAIGNTRRLELKRSWRVPPILWCAMVGESGTTKTPAFQLAIRPVRKLQALAMERYAEAMKQYRADYLMWEKNMTAWKRNKSASLPPAEPEAPHAERFIVSDITVEALAPILLENPRGLLLARDELAAWTGSFDRYAKGKASADAAIWLSMFNAESVTVDRKTGAQRTIYVPQAAVCVCGGIQPRILRRALSAEHRESGLAARLLLAWPPRKPKHWTEADIDPGLEQSLEQLFAKLYELQFATGSDGKPHPVLVRLNDEAKAVWIAYYNAHALELVDLDGDLASAWSKLEEYAPRLALVVHYVRWANGEVADEHVLDADSMKAGIALTEWFKNEARRVYAMLDESDEEHDQRRLIEWIARHGGTVTIRQVQQGCHWLKAPGAAEAALEALVKANCGTWQDVPPGPSGGRPTRVFVLSTRPSAAATNADMETGTVS